MTHSLSDIALPTFLGGLGALSRVLEVVGDHPDASEIIEARLYEDMFDFRQQIQAATDTARRVVERIAGLEASSRPDLEPTIASLRARVQETTQGIEAADRETIDARAETSFTVDLGREMTFTGYDYVRKFGMPNFLFHVSTAYAIARHRGAPLGKIDYIAPFMR